jgi:hypothetical protein
MCSLNKRVKIFSTIGPRWNGVPGKWPGLDVRTPFINFAPRLFSAAAATALGNLPSVPLFPRSLARRNPK